MPLKRAPGLAGAFSSSAGVGPRQRNSPSLTAAKTLGAIGAVAGKLPLSKKLWVGHDRAVGVDPLHMLDISIVVGKADHEARPLADTSAEFGKPDTQRRRVHPVTHSAGTAPAGGGVSSAVQRFVRKASIEERTPKYRMLTTTRTNSAASAASMRSFQMIWLICAASFAGARTWPLAAASA